MPKIIKIAKKTPSIFLKGTKTIAPKTLRGKINTGTGGLIGLGILKESPKARKFTVQKVKSAPSIPGKIVSFGESVGRVIEGEKVFGKEDVIKGVNDAGIIGGTVALGTMVMPKIISKIKEKDKPFDTGAISQLDEIPPQKQIIKEKPTEAITTKPSTVPIQTISTGRKPIRRRRAKKKVSTTIKQSINLNVINNSGNRKYIKRNNYVLL